ncbi:cell division protein ZapA [Pseudaquabacterium rugosum]|uniref:Cell division protein ZapA n=1 Tax=Pseudaquabacterium rugosum TaxID=2984194 RepID=A0ABU9BEB2_9BURK
MSSAPAPTSLEATILGQSYALACPPGQEAQLRDAAGLVDREMCAIRDAGRVKARERIAVLTALNLAWQQIELQARLNVAARPVAAPVAVAAPAAQPATDTDADAGRSAIDAATERRIGALIDRLDAALAAI